MLSADRYSADGAITIARAGWPPALTHSSNFRAIRFHHD
jgi:hypothetical protein